MNNCDSAMHLWLITYQIDPNKLININKVIKYWNDLGTSSAHNAIKQNASLKISATNSPTFPSMIATFNFTTVPTTLPASPIGEQLFSPTASPTMSIKYLTHFVEI